MNFSQHGLRGCFISASGPHCGKVPSLIGRQNLTPIKLSGSFHAKTGAAEKADALFQKTVAISTLSETYLNYADFLRSQGRNAEAREWTKRVLAKKPTLPSYLKRRERPWFRRAKGLLKQLPAS